MCPKKDAANLCDVSFDVEGLPRHGWWRRLHRTCRVEDCLWHHTEGRCIIMEAAKNQT